MDPDRLDRHQHISSTILQENVAAVAAAHDGTGAIPTRMMTSGVWKMKRSVAEGTRPRSARHPVDPVAMGPSLVCWRCYSLRAVLLGKRFKCWQTESVNLSCQFVLAMSHKSHCGIQSTNRRV